MIAPDNPSPQTRRALVVDDDEILRRMTERILVQAGWLVLTAEDGVSALNTMRIHRSFDAVVTDHSMPRMTGLELVRQILVIAPDTPIVVCSGSISSEIAEDYLALGVRSIVHKPFRAATLVESVHTAAGRH